MKRANRNNGFGKQKVNSENPKGIPISSQRNSEGIPISYRRQRKMIKVKIIKTYFVENTNVDFGEDDSKILLLRK